ncbi:ubiquitin carboxyl-terminal hydrolase 7-like isoform X3 [Daphnia pulicaria]|uniref:ubiquitin carboxyl-terminal hydrolase 7-like isoform X3 n=1 Tax=Daphnia pulicaria TaxID=35523 RepID=UPI001EEADC6F|nr:ubiquitin carboxyl-terminal hydrolase 7-like isoform X3 [Daphnia pulicaria]
MDDNLTMREDEFVADANIISVLQQRLKWLIFLQCIFYLLLAVVVKDMIWPFAKYWWNLLKLKWNAAPPVDLESDLVDLESDLGKCVTDLADLIPSLRQRAGLPPHTQLELYEEVKPGMIDTIEHIDKPLETNLEELMDGDIICYQKYDPEVMGSLLGTLKKNFYDLLHRIEVTFCDKTNPLDVTGFTLSMSEDLGYDQVARLVGDRIGYPPNMLQFFKSQGYREGPGPSIRYHWETSLKEMVTSAKVKQPKKLFYLRLTMPITELESKRQFKCTWVNSRLKDEKELTLYPAKTATVAELLEEARKHMTLSENGSGKLRLLEIVSYKIQSIVYEEIRLDMLNTSPPRWFRVEEIPKDELEIGDDELLIPVAHFSKEIYSGFGIPFLLKVREAEPFSQVKERIQKRLEVPDKEFEKYKFAVVVMTRIRNLTETPELTLNLEDFKPPLNQRMFLATFNLFIHHRSFKFINLDFLFRAFSADATLVRYRPCEQGTLTYALQLLRKGHQDLQLTQKEIMQFDSLNGVS